MELLIAFLVLNLVPSLILGHWAEAWGRPRTEWTWASILFSWCLVGIVLLVIGRDKAAR